MTAFLSPFLPPPVSDETGRLFDVIQLSGLEVDCIVGVYPDERQTPQPLVVDLALYLDTRAAALGEGLKATVDYARVSGELRFLLESCRFLLLETAAEALCRYLLAPPTGDALRARPVAVSMRLMKPRALAGGVLPSVEVHRRAREVRFEVEEKDFGKVDVIHQSKGCGIYRLRIAPGKSIPTHVHHVMEERELILGAGLLLQRHPIAPGTAFAWPKGLPHRYDNPTDTEQTILCVDRPAFIPADEIEVEEPDGGLVVVEGARYYP